MVFRASRVVNGPDDRTAWAPFDWGLPGFAVDYEVLRKSMESYFTRRV